VRTLSELEGLGRTALADRFGVAGVLAHRLAQGEDEPLRPRPSQERLREMMDIGDASSGPALQRVLGVLVDRLLARPEREGRTLRVIVLFARLLAGGGWRERVVLRQALSERERVVLALSARLELLPAPAATLGLVVEHFGPPGGEQRSLLAQGDAVRGARLREEVTCPGRTRCCGPSAWTPTRACPSGGCCSRRCRADGCARGVLCAVSVRPRRCRGDSTPWGQAPAPGASRAASGVGRAVNLPRPARVRIGRGGVPVEVDGRAVELLRESWLVEDRWWTAEPLRRRYWELVDERGRNVVVFRDMAGERDGGGWFTQGT
jgi:hypothetical protein